MKPKDSLVLIFQPNMMFLFQCKCVLDLLHKTTILGQKEEVQLTKSREIFFDVHVHYYILLISIGGLSVS